MVMSLEVARWNGTRKAQWAVACYFFAYGVCVATWAPHIPLAKERLAVSPGWFGAALLCMGLGAVTAMPVAGGMIGRYGSARVMTAAGVVSSIALALPFAAPNLALFGMALFVFGAGAGALDVAMNAQGLAVERALRRPVISGFHALYSVAGLMAGGASALVIDRIPELLRGLMASAFCLGLIFIAHRFLLPSDADRGKSRSALALPTRATIGLGLLCFLTLMIEGSVLEWAGIHLRENLGASAVMTSLLVAGYSGAMAASRFLGDWGRLRFGSAKLVASGALLAGMCLAVAVTAPNATISLLAFALSGFMLGPVAPVLFAGGGRAEPDNPGHGIAAVSTMGYSGAILAPPLIGVLAEFTGIAIALGLTAIFAFIVSWRAPLAAVADGNEEPPITPAA
jgi:fucose permease